MLHEDKLDIKRNIVDKVKENKIRFIPIDENELTFYKTKQRVKRRKKGHRSYRQNIN
jgi:hypothetical protein|tara:strand:- start:4582 stop:4752 length:171 start_codon:yes stop_codon:yes gene_type:complete